MQARSSSTEGNAEGALASHRVIALGASNLTRGLHVVVGTARAEWGRDVEVLAALGHGRSYGAPSHFLARTLPGILHSGLWSQLSRMPPAHTRGLITDVGNDILYGFSPPQILAWVREAIDRLEFHGAQVTITGLPAVGAADISPGRFLFFRSVFFPRCRLSLADVALRAAQIGDGLEELAVKRGLRLVRLNREWYGVDPIHIRPSRWQTAWQEILCGPGEPRPLDRRRREALKLYAMRPEQQWICGVPFGARQTGRTLRSGGRVWLF